MEKINEILMDNSLSDEEEASIQEILYALPPQTSNSFIGWERIEKALKAAYIKGKEANE